MGTPIEIWQKAITMFPEIVEKYGEFSSELLQAMLGVPSAPASDVANNNTFSSKDNQILSPLKVSKHMSNDVRNNSLVDCEDNHLQRKPSKQLDRASSTIPTYVKDVVFAGQIGVPVKAIGNIVNQNNTRKDYTSNGVLSDTSALQGPSTNLSFINSSPHTLFEVDSKRQKEERATDTQSNSILLEPDAPLIRSMRRCERKLPPLLDHWAMVDVALTKYELVYFDVTVVKELDHFRANVCEDSEGLEASYRNKLSTVREALIATKGGKNLRLRDVAHGRKIVGHVDLTKIDFVKLLKILPSNVLDNSMVRHRIGSEYWKPQEDGLSEVPEVLACNKQRWECVLQHVMKIQSTHGILLLRFFSDLEYQENPIDSDVKVLDPTALVWCRTIGSICSSIQSKKSHSYLGRLG